MIINRLIKRNPIKHDPLCASASLREKSCASASLREKSCASASLREITITAPLRETITKVS